MSCCQTIINLVREREIFGYRFQRFLDSQGSSSFETYFFSLESELASHLVSTQFHYTITKLLMGKQQMCCVPFNKRETYT